MIADNTENIAKRFGIISVMMPLVCVIMTFAGFLISGIESLYSLIPPLSFAACFGFIFTFFIDIRKKTALNSTFKIILLLAGTGICFFAPSFMDSFGITLVVVLAVSLFCSFLSIEASLILMVGFCLFIWAFRPTLLNSEMIVYITAILLVCIMNKTCDNFAKMIYSIIIFTVFYLILNLIFRRMQFSELLDITVFTIWFYSVAIIVCLYLIRTMMNENAYQTMQGKASSDTDTGLVTFSGSGNDSNPDKDYTTESKKKAGQKTQENDNTPEPGKVAEPAITQDTSGNRNADKIQSDTRSENKQAVSDSSDSSGLEKENANPQNTSRNVIADKSSNPDAELSENKDSAGAVQNAYENDIPNDTDNKASSKNDQNKHRKLYDSIEELSTRLMKLESENSLLQLMINSSVYDLSTITDPDYPYIIKIRDESPKNYRHCLKVAQISADAAELIKCDSEEAYAIGMYLRAPKVLGDGASAVLSKTYRIPKSIITSVYKINDKANATVMSREAGIVMLTDDIIYSYNYLKSKTKENISIERIVNNVIKVRKDQNCLRSAGFTNEEIQLLRLYYIDLGDQYDTIGTE